MKTLLESNLPDLPLISRGKVRDIYAVGSNLLLIASDRISAFDHILATGIPNKGRILTQLSAFWFGKLASVVPNHMISTKVEEYPAELAAYRETLEGRSMLVKRAEMFPVECVVRGYLSGSGWKDYQSTGVVGGIRLPAGLRESDKLPEPIFTPATKAADGEHDENITFDQMVDQIGRADAEELRRLSLAIYHKAAEHAESCGIIIADTKFEFGRDQNGILLCDEALTPDSSRFWPRDQYEPGRAQPSFDKQFVRDYLEKIRWNKQAPAPGLPEEVAHGTEQRYAEAYTLLTGTPLAE